ncbi:WUSCHEL-related homeobox 9 [Cynara cardunculus var. scolymus]|uniref:WUSCHEL-related homeobox 9 n=1 Tax=Cynara cardunculus var. scolymus TaxID=59895 RepID=UPI000D623EFA|nr:WUSCHEL-related homeobox 9 [Cynara cardunculus var. scolymus]
MASSNRHWPSMFKSKPTCNTHHHHQWQSQDSNNNLLSSTCHRSPYSSGCEERSPEPKPRWNPKPEQIRILESIFNSGMVNPPRDEIRKIRTQLQEYGQVGDANVFYWFQNRKSRSKHKNRHLQKSQNHQSLPVSATTTKGATTSSSSSSEKSSSKSIEFLLNSPTDSVDQQGHGYFGGGGTGYHHQHHSEFLQEPFFFTTVQHPPPPPPASTTTASFTEGFCFSELGNVMNEDHNHGNLDETVGSGSAMLLTDLMMMNHQNGMPKNNNSKCVEEEKMMKLSSYNFTPPSASTSIVHLNPTTTAVPSTVNIQGVEEPAPGKSTVFINDVAFEVAVGPFNVREAFGNDAVLVHSYGQPVVTNEWGVTLHSLQHGAVYYLVRSFSFDHSSAIDLVYICFPSTSSSHTPPKFSS